MTPIQKAKEIAVKYNNWVEETYLKGEETGLWFTYRHYANEENGITDDELYSLWAATPEAAALLSGEDWISVNDRLPEVEEGEADEVIINSQVEDKEDVVITGVFYNGKFYVGTEWNKGNAKPLREGRITHWQPIPEPPKP